MRRVGGGSGEALGYMPQLDGLRCLAAASVLVCHFAPQGGAVLGAFRWGDAGVQLFFVLSGFLITTILLRVETAAGAAAQPARRTLVRFYARRFLRILPPYYALLAVLALLGVQGVRESLLWHVTYTTNFYLAATGEWQDNVFHFWTLAVEEQFYLVWPCVVLFAPRRWLGPVCVAAIAAAAPYRLATDFAGWSETAVYVPPIANVDTLAAGSLLALFAAADDERRLGRRLRLALGLGLPLLVATVAARNLGLAPTAEAHLWRLSLVLVGPWIVFGAARGFRGPVGRLLELPAVVYLGRVSYGVYLYHVGARVAVDDVVARLGLGGMPYPLVVTAWVGATVGLAALSWHMLEAPLARRRRRVAYVADQTGLGHSRAGRAADGERTSGGAAAAGGGPAATRASAPVGGAGRR